MCDAIKIQKSLGVISILAFTIIIYIYFDKIGRKQNNSVVFIKI